MKARELTVCGLGMCPTVFEITLEGQACGIGACPGVFQSDSGDLIIVGAKLSAEEAVAVAHKVNVSEETAVRVSRALIAGLKL